MNSKEMNRKARAVERSWLKKNGYASIFAKKKKKNKEKFKKNKRFNFYKSERWVRLRKRAFATYGAVCMKCGATGKKAEMQVDHIKPRSLFPELQYVFDNLQILCAPCNSAKSNKNCSDYRTVPEPSVTKYFGIKDE